MDRLPAAGQWRHNLCASSERAPGIGAGRLPVPPVNILVKCHPFPLELLGKMLGKDREVKIYRVITIVY